MLLPVIFTTALISSSTLAMPMLSLFGGHQPDPLEVIVYVAEHSTPGACNRAEVELLRRIYRAARVSECEFMYVALAVRAHTHYIQYPMTSPRVCASPGC